MGPAFHLDTWWGVFTMPTSMKQFTEQQTSDQSERIASRSLGIEQQQTSCIIYSDFALSRRRDIVLGKFV